MVRTALLRLLLLLALSSATADRVLEDAQANQEEQQQQQQQDEEQEVQEDVYYTDPSPPYLSQVSYSGCVANKAYFTVCPPAAAGVSCNRFCRGGTKFETDLGFFLTTYAQAKSREQEYLCRLAEENCEDANCYAQWGCTDEDMWDWANDEQQQQNGDDQEEQAAAEGGIFYSCQQYDENFYAGPRCVNGKIYQGYFLDYNCMNATSSDLFATTYGYEMPNSYETGEPLIGLTACASCNLPYGEQGQEYNQEDFYQYQFNSAFADESFEIAYQCPALMNAGGRITKVKSPIGLVGAFFKSTWGIVAMVTLALVALGFFAARMGSYLAGGGPSGTEEPILVKYTDAGSVGIM